MVHAIRMLKCNKGHILPISYDSNECGCHHNGKPCIIITCEECFKEELENKNSGRFEKIQIPLDEEGNKIIRELLK